MAAFSAADIPDLSGKTVIVTGASSGIGRTAAAALAGSSGPATRPLPPSAATGFPGTSLLPRPPASRAPPSFRGHRLPGHSLFPGHPPGNPILRRATSIRAA
jgi:hypothetical protein